MKIQGLLHPPKRTGCLLIRGTQKASDFFLPSLYDEPEKSEKSDKGTIQFSVYKCFCHKNVKTL